jgi:DNA-binding GntR family transcriptional regulator
VSDGPHRDGQSVRLVRDRLRDAILRGEIGAGEVRSQTSLSEEFGAGRSVVREALRLLDMEGLVIREPNKRVRVAELTAADAEGLFIVRLSLEIPAARLTVPTMHFDDVGQLEGLFAHMGHYGRGKYWAGLTEPHREFHLKLVAAGGSRAVALIRQHFDYAERYQLAYVQQTIEEWATRQAEHRGLIDAATEGNAELVAWRLAEHYARAAARLCLCLDPGYEPAKLRDTIHGMVPGCEAALDAISSP